jgi:hypothetical protein
MTLTAIRPGEHLAEELRALDMSAAELARKIDVPTNRVTQILKRRARHHGCYGPAPRSGGGRKVHQGTSHVETPGARPRMKKFYALRRSDQPLLDLATFGNN